MSLLENPTQQIHLNKENLILKKPSTKETSMFFFFFLIIHSFFVLFFSNSINTQFINRWKPKKSSWRVDKQKESKPKKSNKTPQEIEHLRR